MIDGLSSRNRALAGQLRRVVLTLVLAATAAACSALGVDMVVGSGNLAIESRDVTSIDTVVLRGSSDVDVTIGEPASLEVEADDNIVPLVVTAVEEGILTITTEGSFRSKKGVLVRLVTPALSEVRVEGSGDVTGRGIDARSFSAAVNGSGDIEIEGIADEVGASVRGSGDIDLSRLSARRAKASVSGSGDIELRVSEALDARVTGSGDISYRGDPADVSVDVSGSGDVERLD